MRTEKEHIRISIKHVLRTIAMMHIPVSDKHTLHAMVLLSISCRHGDIVEYTEAHPYISTGMMTRRSDRTEGLTPTLPHHKINCIAKRAHSMHGHVEGILRDTRVAR